MRLLTSILTPRTGKVRFYSKRRVIDRNLKDTSLKESDINECISYVMALKQKESRKEELVSSLLCNVVSPVVSFLVVILLWIFINEQLDSMYINEDDDNVR
jgi:hypothetical protein